MRYYPNAIASSNFGGNKPFYQSTYDSVDSVEEALKCFKGWVENYRMTIYCAWVADTEGNVVWLKSYVDALGFTRPPKFEEK